MSLWCDSVPSTDTIPMTTTPTDPPSDRKTQRKELERLLAEDSPREEQLRRLRDRVRTEVFGLEPLCPECEEKEESDSSESEEGM